MYKYEMHLHTYPCSDCSVSSMEEMVAAAKENGYAGFVVTNHFYHGNTGIDRQLPWEEFVEKFAEDWHRGVELGKKQGINVLFGVEEGYDRGKEVLIYGLTPEEFAAKPELRERGLKALSEYVHEKGGIVVHAHPFRIAPYIPDPDTEPDASLLDGVEVNNQNGTKNRNELAKEFAEKNGLFGTSGGDVHSAKNFGRAGLAFYKPISNSKELVGEILAGNYRLIVDGKIV